MLASVLGVPAGVERQQLDWAAGLHTHLLVCIGAALMMIVSAFGFEDILGTSNAGFLGAGGGLYLPAIATTVLALIILVKPYKKKLVKHKRPIAILLKVNMEKTDLRKLENVTLKLNLEYSQIIVQKSDKEGISTVQMRLNETHYQNLH